MLSISIPSKDQGWFVEKLMGGGKKEGTDIFTDKYRTDGHAGGKAMWIKDDIRHHARLRERHVFMRPQAALERKIEDCCIRCTV